MTPHDVTKGSKKRVWWKCLNGHDWEAIIANRTKGSKCPVCSRKRLMGT
ncbi:MAG: zinc-ribbon domain-containing protein [Lachnospiraceae bacterium]|nr:zinc-ribbon domain-containing protein [Lachnospiraceae bacterium]